jgi:hypothetical protein
LVRVNQIPEIGDNVISYFREGEKTAYKGKFVSKDEEGNFYIEFVDGDT